MIVLFATAFAAAAAVSAEEEGIKPIVFYDDLAAASISVNPAAPADGQNAAIEVKVKNGGNRAWVSAQGLSSYRYDFEDFILEKANYINPDYSHMVGAGGEVVYTFNGRFSRTGTKKLSFSADAANDMKESNEDNNKTSATVSVVDCAEQDLAVDSITFNQRPIFGGRDLEMTVNIKNIASTSLIQSAGLTEQEIIYSFEDFIVASTSRDEFPSFQKPFVPGEIFKYKFQGKFRPAGRKKLSFAFDRVDNIKERNNKNNATTTEIYAYDSENEFNEFRIENLKASPVSSSSVMFAWQTTQPAVGKAYCKENLWILIEYAAENAAATSAHRLIVSGLKPGLSYLCFVEAKNGSVEKKESLNLATPQEDDFRFVKKPEARTDAQNRKSVVGWQTSYPANAFVYLKKAGGDYASTSLADFTAAPVYEAKELSPGRYYFYAVSESAAGRLESEEKYFDIVEAEIKNEAAKNKKAESDAETGEKSAGESVKDKNFFGRLKGKIILRSENRGEAYYLDPKTEEKYYLGRPADAFAVMRRQGVGIKNSDLQNIPLGLAKISGADTDGDGLSDAFEDAIGTDKNKADTDSDGFPDGAEIAGGYSPVAKGAPAKTDRRQADRQKGRILLQVEGRGEAWYVDPADGKRYFLGRAQDAFTVMRQLGLGVGEKDFGKL